jgi:hypothetical protein
MDLKAAHACLVAYVNSWGEVGLTWEPPFLDFWTVNGPPESLDDGWSLWQRLQGTEFWGNVPLSVRLGLRTKYFQTILTLAEDDGKTRTSKGMSKGYAHFLAGCLDSALVLLQREAVESPDDPVTHLHLGNARYLLNDIWSARAAYRDALLIPLKPQHYPEILDADVRAFLTEAEPGDWVAVEACIRAVLPVSHLRSQDSIARFLEKNSWLTNADSSPLPSPVRQFYACLVISESRAFLREDVVMKARLHMKFLHGRLHKLHMETLDSKRV